MKRILPVMLSATLLLLACGDDDQPPPGQGDGGGSSADGASKTDAGEEASGAMKYYAHPCGNGDPVPLSCGPNVNKVTVDDSTYPLCSDQGIAAGDACSSEAQRCVIAPAEACDDDPTRVISSAAYLYCREEGFAPAPCPVSRRSAKEKIRYLTPADEAQLADEILGLRLARYRYRDPAPPDSGPQLGFIIDDHPNAAFVIQRQQRVNLYAYASALVATVRQQQRALEVLGRRVRRLESRLRRSKR